MLKITPCLARELRLFLTAVNCVNCDRCLQQTVTLNDRKGWPKCNTFINVNSWSPAFNPSSSRGDTCLSGLHTAQEERYCTLYLGLMCPDVPPPVSCPAQTNSPPQWESRILCDISIHFSFRIFPSDSVSRPSSLHLSPALVVICLLSSSSICSLFLALPSVSSRRKEHLAKRYAQGMFTSLNDWWGVMKQSNLE